MGVATRLFFIWAAGLVLFGVWGSVNWAYAYPFSFLDWAILTIVCGWIAFATVVVMIATLEQREELSTERFVDSVLVYTVSILTPGLIFGLVGGFAPLSVEAQVVLVVVALYAVALHGKFAAEELRKAPWYLMMWISVIGSFAFTSSTAGAAYLSPTSTAGIVWYGVSVGLLIIGSVLLFWIATRYGGFDSHLKKGSEKPSAWLKLSILCACLIIAYGVTMWFGTFNRVATLVVEQAALCAFYLLFFLFSLYRMFSVGAKRCFGQRRADQLAAGSGKFVSAGVRFWDCWFTPYMALVYGAVCGALGVANLGATAAGIAEIVFAVLQCVAWFVGVWKHALTVAECALMCFSTAVFWIVLLAVPTSIPSGGATTLLEILWPVAVALSSVVLLRSEAPTPAPRQEKERESERERDRPEWTVRPTRANRVLFAHLPALGAAVLTSAVLATGVRATGQLNQAGAFVSAIFFLVFTFIFVVRGIQHSFEALVTSTPDGESAPKEKKALRNRVMMSHVLWFIFLVAICLFLASMVVAVPATVNGTTQTNSALWIAAVCIVGVVVCILAFVLLCVR